MSNITLENMTEELLDTEKLDVTIKKVTIEDISEIQSMMTDMNSFILNELKNSPYAKIDESPYVEDVTFDHISSILEELYTIIKDGTIIGYAQFGRNSSTNLHIYSLFVKSEYRGNGIGKITLQRITNYAKSNGYITITIRSVVSNIPSMNLYKSFGFEEYHVSLVKNI